ncbi:MULTISPECIES: Na+/H+ antiporter NhaA [unclassified Rothia (in: high G+C Gram-positive bacteria)]|uniref:Na+/H+ antiporter NhaA n=1 Tax=unclassified Rothia (in: high G+C Gram-positive bacteria) TaxID=2689056 RepID=UPI001956D7C9|nr:MULTISPECIES: Na+/H+ antiporter NhaA [unclassified Rothia (in: high G+C Gram-positive bacteria)]MBM7052285.1 Na+/H+ antiporter NhaA [Rothia sp. ZJ1223]QRZ61515.1 Na+/H+ antiporter NhaA [Rothia sp. ZJ932]
MASDNTVLTRGTYKESQRVSEILRKESVGGIILLIATIAALVFANSPAADTYFGIRDSYIGRDIGDFHLKLSIGHWAADGLLAVFFFLVGLELKKEFVMGALRNPSTALVPMVAAAGGVLMPSLIYFFINMSGSAEARGGWAIPAATDIAFAVAVLAVIGSHLPAALRIFLLTLAVVDDLIAITIIALFYTSELKVHYLLWAIIPIILYAVIARFSERLFHLKPIAAWLVLMPIGFIVWALFLNSGIHATIAGVILAFTVPVRMNKRSKSAHAEHGLAEVMEHNIRPFSAGFCVPVFAFFSAGVALGGWEGFTSSLTKPIAYGIILALVFGKMLGIFSSTWLVTRFRGANLDPDIKWVDILGVATLAGIGFTVSLLVAELSFGLGSDYNDDAKVAILTGSVTAAVLGSIILGLRNKHYKNIALKEAVDADEDGIPDVFSDNGSGIGGGSKRA